MTDVPLTDSQATLLQQAEEELVAAQLRRRAAADQWALTMREARQNGDKGVAVAVSPKEVDEAQHEYREARADAERRAAELDALRTRLYAERTEELKREALLRAVTENQTRHDAARRALAEHERARRGVLGRLFGRR